MANEPIDPWVPANVDTWSSESDSEPLGSKEKFWVRDSSGDRWLFKFARTGGQDQFVSGEDWAEILASSCGLLLGIPIAKVRLGMWQGRRGTLSRSVVPVGWTLVHGNELMSLHNEHYVGGQPSENPLYTVASVREVLMRVPAPIDWPGPELMNAFDVWAGYLTFDAWVAGCDRHDENWGAMTDGTHLHLAPSFDHGNALGFQVRPADHLRLATNRHDIETWAGRGRCRYFASRPRLVELARMALALASATARDFWMTRLADLTSAAIEAEVLKAPETILSVPSRMFCEQLLLLNRRRLLDDN